MIRYATFIRAAMLGVLLAVCAPALVMVGGCAAIGAPQPKSFDQSLAYAYATHTAVIEAAANAVAGGRLSANDGDEVLKLGNQSRAILDGARVAQAGGDMTTAQGKLTLALNVLTQLQTYLNSRGVK